MQQRLVKLILFLWPFMPLFARIWAMRNDSDLQDVKVNNKDKA